MIKTTIENFIANNNLPHLLFHGPPGVGKTSLIMACAKKLYGNESATHMLELNASDERGIGIVRNRIKQFASTGQFFDKKVKLIVLDEADMMTSDAQMALRCIIEKYSKTVRFCIICNNITGIINALQSRCLKFIFKPIEDKYLTKKAKEIITAENMNISAKPLKLLIKTCGGDMRKLINRLETLEMMTQEKIRESDIYKITDFVAPSQIVKIHDLLMHSSYDRIFKTLYSVCINKGASIHNIVSQLHEHLFTEHFCEDSIKMKLTSALARTEFSLVNTNDSITSIMMLISGYIDARPSNASKNQFTADAPMGTADAPMGTADAPMGTADAPMGTADAPMGTASGTADN